MFVYFLEQIVCALIERQLRNAMRERGLPHIQILPEDRPSKTPTTEQVFRVFSSRTRHLLLILLHRLREVVRGFLEIRLRPLVPKRDPADKADTPRHLRSAAWPTASSLRQQAAGASVRKCLRQSPAARRLDSRACD